MHGAAGTGGMTSIALIAQREQELALLRHESIQSLEQQVESKGEALQAAEAQLAALQATLQRNMDLLEQRGEQLAQCKQLAAATQCEVADKAELIAQMQTALAEAELALRDEHTTRIAAEQQLVQQSRALKQEVQRIKDAGAADLYHAQNQLEFHRQRLEHELERQVQRAAEQQRIAAAAHMAGLERLEVEQAARLQELRLQLEVAEQLVQRRDAEMHSANEQLRVQAVQAASLEAGAAAQARDLQAAQQSAALLERQLHLQQQRHASETSELCKVVQALRNALEDQRGDSSAQLGRAEASLAAQAQRAECEARDASVQAEQLAAELDDARAALEVQHATLQQQLEQICADRERQVVAAQEACMEDQQQEQLRLIAALTQAEAEARTAQERHLALQGRVEQQQEELAAAQVLTAKCQQLQVQLDAAERRAFVLAAGQGPNLQDLEGMLCRLSAQRDSAQAAAADTQAQLSLKEAELQQLQERQRQWKQDGSEAFVGQFNWPSNLSSESLDDSKQQGTAGGTVVPEVAALQAALAAEQQQTHQLRAALHAVTADMQGVHQGQHHVRLKRQLARAQAQVRQLAAENERLMELGNSLRAERTRMLCAPQSTGRGAQHECQEATAALQLAAAPPALPPAGAQWPLATCPAAQQRMCSTHVTQERRPNSPVGGDMQCCLGSM
ncbi:hypothetical protein D9Q98_001626 [Chlorella vulgaris]|uniref:Uncharacterized protein n=1 Tax=Chlorella vulgaris TaxID=3077 RepID=A0A9D4TV46_CHLVU|nr:hypothetical protein D9Q98_001626 [Chlorella vulgaris]